MHAAEIQAALDSMVLLVDTREQDTPRLRLRLRQSGCPWERKKLDFGDYSAKVQLPAGDWLNLSGAVAVERKMSVDELAQCYTRSRERFAREFERARAAGARLYLLVEDASWEAVYAGEYRTQVKPQAIVASCLAWMARYDCRVLFCAPRTSGLLLRDILYREAKERLETEAF